MTAAPLPPFPRPSVFDPGRFGVAYSQPQMVDFATQARADLEAENKQLRTLLAEAADDIESWGAYASDYFQKKHDLAGCVAKYRATLEKPHG